MLDIRMLGEPCGEPSEAREALGSIIGAQGAAVGRSDQRWVAASLPRCGGPCPPPSGSPCSLPEDPISRDLAEGDPETSGVQRAGSPT